MPEIEPDHLVRVPGHDELMRSRPPSGERVAPLPPALRPGNGTRDGRYARLEPLDAGMHAADLYAASHCDDAARRLWDYLPYGPFASEAAFAGYLRDNSSSADPLFFAVRDRRTGRAGGLASYLNIEPKQGSIEIGHIWFGPPLQNTAAATESLYLLMRHVMDERGYRRLEWKCDALNAASRHAAVRLGFTFEGIFYQHRVVKGRNRDTAWFSLLDREWPPIRAGFETWLDPANFDAAGRQRSSLSDLTRAARES